MATCDAATGNALDMAEMAFAFLVTGPAPPTLDGAAIGHGLPARPVCVPHSWKWNSTVTPIVRCYPQR